MIERASLSSKWKLGNGEHKTKVKYEIKAIKLLKKGKSMILRKGGRGPNMAGVQAGPDLLFGIGGVGHDGREGRQRVFEVARTKRGRPSLNKSLRVLMDVKQGTEGGLDS